MKTFFFHTPCIRKWHNRSARSLEITFFSLPPVNTMRWHDSHGGGFRRLCTTQTINMYVLWAGMRCGVWSTTGCLAKNHPLKAKNRDFSGPKIEKKRCKNIHRCHTISRTVLSGVVLSMEFNYVPVHPTTPRCNRPGVV